MTRASALWWGVLAASLVLFALAMPGCAGRFKNVPTQTKSCALNQADPAVADALHQLQASASSAPGAPSWQDFAAGELLSRGLGFATCLVVALLGDLDAQPGAPPAVDQVGHVAATPELQGFASIADPNALAHNRLVDWLHAHGIIHQHRGAT